MEGFNSSLIMHVKTGRNFEVMSDEDNEVMKFLTI